MNPKIFELEYFGNTVSAYAVAFGILVGGWLVVRIASHIVKTRLKRWSARTNTPLDDFIVDTVQKTAIPLLYFGVAYIALQGLELNPAIDKLMSAAGALLLTFLGINFLRNAIRFLLFGYWLKRHEDVHIEKQVKGLMPVVTVALWTLGIVFLLDNLGFNISAMVAGLGIGGVAVALAGQAILGDLFSYFSIVMDRPFELGDFIIMGDYMGTVEHIGVKTTRIRSLGGEQLIFSNTDLTSSRIRNYKRMDMRRVVFRFGVTYDTGLKELKAIPGIIKAAVEKIEKTKFDRAHFFSYGDSSLVYEVVYYVLSADYNIYMDIQQEINFAIKEQFEARKIEFAFPTQTLYVQRTRRTAERGMA